MSKNGFFKRECFMIKIEKTKISEMVKGGIPLAFTVYTWLMAERGYR